MSDALEMLKGKAKVKKVILSRKGTIYMTRGTLNGVGDTLFSFVNGIIEMLCRIFLPMGLLLIPSVGVWAIWWTAGLTWAISALACLLRYLSWSKKAKAAA